MAKKGLTGVCNTPEKEVFNTKQSASRAVASMVNRRKVGHGSNQVRAYQCGDGHWHITSAPNYGATRNKKQRFKEPY